MSTAKSVLRSAAMTLTGISVCRPSILRCEMRAATAVRTSMAATACASNDRRRHARGDTAMLCCAEDVSRGAGLREFAADHRAIAGDLWPADLKSVVSQVFHGVPAVEIAENSSKIALE